eukprot:m.146190 g.146190  ORF g.146190 m.146190 type:complete len:104 (+) comp38448_c0_seq1:695-1006(+)
MGVGTAAFGPIVHLIIDRYEWRGYLRFLAISFAVTLVLTLLFYKHAVATAVAPAADADGARDGKKKIVDWSLLKNPAFALYVIAVIVMHFGLTVPSIHMVQIM